MTSGPDASDVKLLGINLSRQPKWAQLFICTSGFCLGYILSGVLEEYVFNRLGYRSDQLFQRRLNSSYGPEIQCCNRENYGWYFTLIRSFVYIALLLAQGFRPSHCVNPWRFYVSISAVLMFSTGLSKGSLAYVNFTTELIFKSTKLLPVMLLGTVVPGLRRVYSCQEYVSAVLLVLGLIFFTLADASTTPTFHILGIIMILTSLLLDAILAIMQEAIFSLNPATSQMELLFCTTIVGMPFLLGPMLATGELVQAWSTHVPPPHVYGVVILEAVVSYVGQLSVLSLIALFGAATTTIVTTLRKVFTLLLSYLIFTKPFVLGQHGLGLLLISMGIGLKMSPNILSKAGFVIIKPSKAQPSDLESRGMQNVDGKRRENNAVDAKEEAA